MANYIPPTWVDDESPSVNAANMQAACDQIAENEGRIKTLEETVKTQGETIEENTDAAAANAAEIVKLKAGILVFTNVSVLVAYWTVSTTYPGFGYAATVTCTGVTTDHAAQVYFSPTEAMSGNYAPVATAGTNLVTIYAVAAPVATITLPTVIALKHIV